MDNPNTEELRSLFQGPQPDPLTKPRIGDYVLATKWETGSSTEPIGVGFVETEIVSSAERAHERWFLMDQNRRRFKSNGFRRAEKITLEEGVFIISLLPIIGNVVGVSIWLYLEQFRDYKQGKLSLVDYQI